MQREHNAPRKTSMKTAVLVIFACGEREKQPLIDVKATEASTRPKARRPFTDVIS